MRKLIAVVALATAVACSLDTSTNTGPLVGDVSGTYTLQSINGTPLPFTIVSHDTTVLVDTDTLTLSPSGNWFETVNLRQTVGTAATTNESFELLGYYLRSGNGMNFRTSDGILFYVGTATDTTLLLSDGGYDYVFKR
jgi:hypothetical protein